VIHDHHVSYIGGHFTLYLISYRPILYSDIKLMIKIWQYMCITVLIH